MEAIFDDIASALKAQQTSLRDRYGTFATRLLEHAALGVAIGFGIALGRLLTG